MNKSHRKTIPKIQPGIYGFGNPIWLYKKGILIDRNFRVIASAAMERLKQVFLRQQALIDKMHSIEWRNKFGKIPFHTMNEDHVIVKKPGAHFDVIFPPNTEAPSSFSSVDPVVRPVTIQNPGTSGLHQASEILTTFSINRPTTVETPEVGQAVKIFDSMENYEVTKPRLPSYDSVLIDSLTSTVKPTESILENLIFDASTTEPPFTEFSGATVETETGFETVSMTGSGDEQTVDVEAATHNGEIVFSTIPSKTTSKTEVTSLEPLQHSQTTIESGIKPESIPSSVIDVESIVEKSGSILTSVVIDPTPSITAEEFTTSILGAEATSQIPSTSDLNSVIDTVSVTEETLFESPVSETTVEEYGTGVAFINVHSTNQEVESKTVDSAVDGTIKDSEPKTGIDSTFLVPKLPNQTIIGLDEIHSTTETHFDFLPTEVEIIDETASTFSSVTPIKPFSPLDDVTIGGVTSFDNSRNYAETSTNVVSAYADFIGLTEVSINLNDTAYGSNASFGTSTQDAKITAEIASSSSYAVPPETSINWNREASIMDTVFHRTITEGEHNTETVPMLPDVTKPFGETFSSPRTLFETSTNNTETTTIAHWTFPPSTFSTEATADLRYMSLTEVTPYQSLETEADTTTEMVSSIPETTLTATIVILEERNVNEEVRFSDLKYDLEAITNIISTTPAPTQPTETIVDSNEISSNADVSVQTSTSRAKVIEETVSKSPTSTVRPATTMTYDQMFVITNVPFKTLNTSEQMSTAEVVSIYQPVILTEMTTTLDGTFTFAGIPVNSSTNDTKITMDAPVEKDATLNALSTIDPVDPESPEVSRTLSSAISEQPMTGNEHFSNIDATNIRLTGNEKWTTEIALTSVPAIPLDADDVSNSENGVGDDEDSDYSVRHQEYSSYVTVYPYTTSISSTNIGEQLTEIAFTAPTDIILGTTNVPTIDDGTGIGVEDSEYSVENQKIRTTPFITDAAFTSYTSHEDSTKEIKSILPINSVLDIEVEQNHSKNQDASSYALESIEPGSISLTNNEETIMDIALTDTLTEAFDVPSSEDGVNVENKSEYTIDGQDNTDRAVATTNLTSIGFTSDEKTNTETVFTSPADILTETDDSLDSKADDKLKKGDEYPVERQNNRDYVTENTKTDSMIGSTSYENTMTEIISTDTPFETNNASTLGKGFELEHDSGYLSTNEENNGYATVITDVTPIGSTAYGEALTATILTTPADILRETTRVFLSEDDTNVEEDSARVMENQDERADQAPASPDHEETTTEIFLTPSADTLTEADDSLNSVANDELEKGDEYPVGSQDNREYVTENTDTVSMVGSTSYENTATEIILTDTSSETDDVSTPEKDLELERDFKYLSTTEENNGYATATIDVTSIGSTSYGEASTAKILTTPVDILLETTRVILSEDDTNVEEDSARVMENQDERADQAPASPDHEETTTEIFLTPSADTLTEADDSLNSVANDELEKGDEYPVGSQDNREYVTENTDTVSMVGSTSYENTATEIILTDTSSETDDVSTPEKDLELERDFKYLSTNEENNGYATATIDVTPIASTSYGEALTATISTTPADLVLETTKVLISEDDTKVEEDFGQVIENRDESYHATALPEYRRTMSEIGSAVTIDDMPGSVANVEVEPRFGYLVKDPGNSGYSEYQTNPNLDLEPPRSLYNEIVIADQKTLLSLIPLVIEELRQNNLNAKTKDELSEIFGDLWPLMVNESNRRSWEFMNHQLAMILFEADQHTIVDAGSQQYKGTNSFSNNAKNEFHRFSDSRINHEQGTHFNNLHDLEGENMNPFLQVEHQQPRRAKKDAAMDLELKGEVAPQTGYMESDPLIDAEIRKFFVNDKDKSSGIREVPKA
ncbi:mucin-3A-like isoform X2 [Neodiprion virginianus]|nr:mucin-3A-like isoform X2 [Neodiprion virginianus]